MRRTDQKPKRPGAVELAEGDPRRGSVGPEVGSEMLEVVEAIEEEPGAEAFGVADQVAGGADSSPDDGAAVRLGPDRDDAGGGVPAPEPFILDQREGPFMGRVLVGRDGIGSRKYLGGARFPEDLVRGRTGGDTSGAALRARSSPNLMGYCSHTGAACRGSPTRISSVDGAVVPQADLLLEAALPGGTVAGPAVVGTWRLERR